MAEPRPLRRRHLTAGYPLTAGEAEALDQIARLAHMVFLLRIIVNGTAGATFNNLLAELADIERELTDG